MKIHPYFTFYHFLGLIIILLIINVVIIKSKKENLKKLWNWKVLLVSFLITLLGLFYVETGVSGTFNFKSYGFPRKIFEMYHIIPAFEKDAPVRVYSKMNWENLLQNLLLFYGFILLVFNLLKLKK